MVRPSAWCWGVDPLYIEIDRERVLMLDVWREGDAANLTLRASLGGSALPVGEFEITPEHLHLIARYLVQRANKLGAAPQISAHRYYKPPAEVAGSYAAAKARA